MPSDHLVWNGYKCMTIFEYGVGINEQCGAVFSLVSVGSNSNECYNKADWIGAG
jgi:hypothetical protein